MLVQFRQQFSNYAWTQLVQMLRASFKAHSVQRRHGHGPPFPNIEHRRNVCRITTAVVNVFRGCWPAGVTKSAHRASVAPGTGACPQVGQQHWQAVLLYVCHRALKG
jgi:hypothetical protein